MLLKAPSFGDVLHVAERMRPEDRREIFGTRWTDSNEDLARDVMRCGAFCWVAWTNDWPVAVFGAFPLHPGVWTVFLFATDDFRKIAFSLTKYVRRVMIPSLVKTGAHRAECRSIEGHTDAQRWLGMLGAKPEGFEAGYGRNGENYIKYVWNRDDVLS